MGVGCAEGDGARAGNGLGNVTAGGESDDDGSDANACLLNNCGQDLECAGCGDGATTCNLDEGRCVQCDPDSQQDTQAGCAAGETCTQYGDCVPGGLDCPTADGLPLVECNSDADCAACDPQHQVCDTATNSCVACSDTNVDACQTIEHCQDAACVANCPATCDSDSDCGQCGGEGHEAHACNAHACAQCNSVIRCPDGLTCNEHGTCVEICGLPGQVGGVCDANADCAGCPGDATHCIKAINGGNGTCGAAASGCSDIGNGVVVLPAPFDQVTNACSNDGDCSGVGIQYNVGKLLRELTGLDAIDDANVEYPMSACASATIQVGTEPVSCGICVPCKEDDDCPALDVDEVAGDAFGPLGAIASAILLDQLFGPNDHEIHMFCQPVAAGYGSCVPCPSLLSDCAGPSTGGGSGDGGQCSHGPCTSGAALETGCSSCTEAVCDEDPYCCQTNWDGTCVGLAQDIAACDCGGGSGGGSTCAHDECSPGGPLTASCSACAAAVCDDDDFCCRTDWDRYCVGAAVAEAACSC